jgi:putative ATPase subunit gpP of terminase
MARHPARRREEARKLFLTGEVTSVAEIARRLKAKAHTIAAWKKEEDWDGLRIKIDKRSAEMLVEQLATERVTLNSNHFKLWGVLASQLFDTLRKDMPLDTVKNLERMANILERVQKGQRLARGLSLDGQTEEQIRSEAAAENRALVDAFVEAVKQHVADPDTREKIRQAVLSHLPAEAEDEPATA